MLTKEQIVSWLEGLPEDCLIGIEGSKLKIESKWSKFLSEPVLDFEGKESNVS